MKKRTLMIATAVAALTAGTVLAQAPRESGDHMNPASRNAPAEKIAPNANPGTHGSVGEQKSTPSNRMGEAPGSKRETTGQAPTEQPNAQRQTPKSDRTNNAARPDERNNARTNERNERSRSTTGQGTTEKGQMENRGANENRTNKANERKRSTTGQGTTEKGQMENRGANENRTNKANERNRSTTGQGTMERGQMENRGTNENRSSTTTTTTGGTRGSVNLSSEQRTRIHSIIVGDRSAPRVAHADFDVRTGVRVPRTVHLAPIPRDIVEIEPEWRGFEYFLVGDEIVVVDPATLEIVAVLPA
jgi:hypothetical protein